MASNSSEEHAKLNECKASLTKYVTAIKRDFGKNPKGVIGALIVLLLSCALSFVVAVNIATGNSIFGFVPRTKDHWNQRIELKGMELSQDQVIHGETHGDMFYVDGQIDGKPELFVYYRYVDDRVGLSKISSRHVKTLSWLRIFQRVRQLSWSSMLTILAS